ncbi:MAG: TonB-dependent receptor [Woeseiaceae bacterium]|nr:TonB-dependent receptor [Woeseiaceae bacterium]
MNTWRTCTRAVATLALAAFMVLPAIAQETTSGIRGKVIDDSGAPVASAEVVIRDDRTGIRRQFTTNSSGVFLAARLPVGGPYEITINNTKSVVVPFIELGDTYNLTVNLQEAAAIEEIVAIGQAAQMIDTAPGPQANFDFAEINSAVAFERDIKDVYSIDPRINLDGGASRGTEVNCAGKHPRFNSVTLDGISQNDRFGLNNNGYSTATGMPFPFDAVQQVSVELAPFDVTYGGFSACNVNVVTRSGTNEFTAGVFYEYTDQDLRNDALDGADLSSPDYEEEKYGFAVGGPIIQDRLFFFAAYEETEEPRFLAMGPAGSGNGVERPWLSQADFDRVNTLAQSLYNYDTGGSPGDGAQTEEKIFLRFDWNITDLHNATFIYNYYDGIQLRGSDDDSNEFEFANHFYNKGSETETFTAIVQSQWTDNFSTELFLSSNTMDDLQKTVGDPDFGDHQISYNGRANTIYLGADDSRQANQLNTEATFLKLKAQYLMGDHVITAGYEAEDLEIFNIFVQHSNGGEWDYFDDSQGNPAACDALSAQGRFADTQLADTDPLKLGCGLSGIDRFELGRPSRVYYGSGGGTNIATDAAAQFSNVNHAIYIQDEIFFDQYNLSVVAGLRYEWFTSDDTPVFNQAVSDAIGVRNDAGLDGVDRLMPRLGFTWEATDDVSVRGGIGMYSGGNPNVWISNAWSNDGITNVQLQYRNFDGDNSVFDGTIPLSGAGRPGFDVPQTLVDQVAAVTPADGSTEGVVLLDPDYKQPNELKVALGATWLSPFWDTQIDADILYTRLQDPAIYVDLSQEIVGETVLGQPIYDFATPGVEEVLMLTNTDEEATATVVSLSLNKEFDNGLDLRFGYAYTEAEDVSPMTSFTAGSSWSNLATNDINFPSRGNSNYVTKHRFTLRAALAREFWGDNLTRVTLMGYTKSGQPANFVQSSSDLEGDGFFGRHLVYIPTGLDDPNVVFDSGFNYQQFNAWVNANGFARGEFLERNAKFSKWSTRFDLRLDQEIPLFRDDLKARAFLKIYNFGNLLNPGWGRQFDAPFFSQEVVESSIDSEGRYVYEGFDLGDATEVQEFASLWEARLGFEINFN